MEANKWTLWGLIQVLIVSGTTLFAGTDGGVFRSTDGGDSWKKVNTGSVRSVLSLAVNGPALFAGTSGGVFRSTDGGNTWTASSTGLTVQSVYSLTVNG